MILQVVRRSAWIVLAVAFVLSAAACTKNPEVAKQEYLKSGDRYAEQKKYNEAIVQYRNALQQDPKFGAARLKLAQTYEHLGDGANAYREYVRAADAMPGNVEAQRKAAMYLLAAGQFEDARVRAGKVLEKQPQDVEAQIVLGNALAGLRDFDHAVKQLEEAIALDPSSASAYTSLGAVQFARGSQREAEAAFRKAVDANPKLAGAHMALANFLWAAGRRDEAEASLQQALALEPQNLLAHRALAAFYLATNRAPSAEPHLRALADRDSSPRAPFKLALADYYVATRRVDEAMTVLDPLVKGKDSYTAARTRQAVIEYTRKGSADGQRIVDEVLGRDPKNAEALLVKARFLMAEKKVDEALTRARAAIAADPTSLQAHYLAGTLLRAKNDREGAIKSFNEVLRLNPRAVAAQVQLSELNLAKGDRTAALQLARDAAKSAPDDPVVHLTLARTLLASGELPRAQQEIAALEQRFPNVAPVHALAGSVRMASRDTAGARRAFTRASELDGSNAEALGGLLSLDFAEKKPQAAVARIDQQLAKTPDHPPILLLAARVYASTGDAARAEATLRKAIERDPSSLQAYGMLAQLYASQKRLPDARRSLEEILKQQPASVPVQTLIGMLYEAENNRADARARYERVLQIDPAAAVAANNLAYIYAEEGGNLDLALQLAQRAKEKLPEAAPVSDTLGWIYVKKDLASLGIPHLEQAAGQDPRNFEYQYHLGMAYLQSGETTKARRALERALALHPDSPQADAARQALASL